MKNIKNEMILIKENKDLIAEYLNTGQSFINKKLNLINDLLYQLGLDPLNNVVFRSLVKCNGHIAIKDFILNELINKQGLSNHLKESVFKEKKEIINKFIEISNFSAIILSLNVIRGHNFKLEWFSYDDKGQAYISEESKCEIQEKCRTYIPKSLYDNAFKILDKFKKWYENEFVPLMSEHTAPSELETVIEMFKYTSFDERRIEVDPEGLVWLMNMKSINKQ